MYFFHGIPQKLTLDSHAIEVRRIPKVPFFAVLTEAEILIYQLHPLALISKITKSEDLYVRHGKNKKIAISSEYGIIAVATENNFIAVFNFHLDASKPILVPNPNTERYDDGPGEMMGPITCSVQYKLAIRYERGVSCLEVQGDSIVYSASTAPIIQVSTLETTDPKRLWKVSSKQYDLREVTWFLDHDSLIKKFHFNKRIDTFFWMSSDGRVYANIGVSANTNTKSLFGICTHDLISDSGDNSKKAATALSTNARFSLLYVGTNDGSVYAYEIQDFGRKYVCSHHSKVPSNIGSVTHISTTGDGFQVMVGYELAWISYSPYLHPCSSSDDSEFFKYGFHDGFWDKDGSAFFGLRNLPMKRENSTSVETKQSLETVLNKTLDSDSSSAREVSKESSCLYILPFLKSTITNSAHGSTSIIGVQSSDRLFISKAYSSYNNLAANFGNSSWVQVEYPQTYISAEWPIRYTAISKNGEYIAIAGSHGVAAYNVLNRVWNVFDNGSLEKSITVTCPMLWYDKYLVTGLLHESNSELHVYDSEKKLDDALVDKFVFTSTIVTISLCDDAHLLVYTADNFLHHIYIERLVENISPLFLSHVSSVSFVPVFTTPSRLRTITLLTLRPFLHSDPSQLLSSAILLVLINGKLVTLDPIRAGSSYLSYRCCIISEDVEFFMINEDLESPALYHSMWIMTGNGFRLSMAFGEALSKLLYDDTITKNDAPSKESKELESLKPYNPKQLDFMDDLQSPSFMVKTPDNFSATNTHTAKLTKSVNMLELFKKQSIPLSIPGTLISVIVKSGLFISASTLEHKNAANNMKYCHIQIEVIPFLPDLLKSLLLLFDIDYAVFLVRAYASLRFIDFVLEKLLSMAAECSDSNETLLTNVAILFDNINDANVYKYVLGCLRKIETHYWPNVFKRFGDPQTLMELCLRNNDIKNAARCITIWQVHQGSASCAEVFLEVLKTAFEKENWEVCMELGHYLASLDPTKQLLNSALISAQIPYGQTPKDKPDKNFHELMMEIDDF
ncbi:Rab-specific(Ryh1/Ypt6) Ric1-Rgp1 guanyl-nucleotide exchange factor subunit Ric1/Sat4 [Schizosaccharomyces osmophilus]|uniref:Rab-specific(Ryh1/Ypt6) Ric1-Rgp1 guanyl-nucleotide exchange factor subunit Ric1/Sat4 n=1 Tax=Schizosaccharomyces osmophilus TaxID=2545709 RepID=A0AAF0AX44_9SCHI|nr:Rab-specific(Ryh1/Ypt6) Ric1-Rgp1 guanyl-nucleotide exchange factor subunit Ric1/Sat4 [Schizosaccharomyces osmophilus]WBW73938.1 Rab-specific(Ryh1/Ypt6) Ric1-Rgp1 guanyl-nucleotide exchange factor subunit Ric1/Sat4 [Schizosaccharomyces osmophilus]